MLVKRGTDVYCEHFRWNCVKKVTRIHCIPNHSTLRSHQNITQFYIHCCCGNKMIKHQTLNPQTAICIAPQWVSYEMHMVLDQITCIIIATQLFVICSHSGNCRTLICLSVFGYCNNQSPLCVICISNAAFLPHYFNVHVICGAFQNHIGALKYESF